ncbi:hypothetical protein [Gemella cuniculi]|uniref:hypothetical protein n=1 Tax=Gemella cuniculi TaxID=150240 RepID=UPI0004251018|nr:hypothetical protein [Gemella cuniculi]
MNTVVIWIIIGVIAYLIDIYKNKDQKSKEKTKVNKKVKNVNEVQRTNNVQRNKSYNENKNYYNNGSGKKVRQIVDREKEIYSNSQIIDKEKLVNDIIFSEILSRPKSKR